MAIFEVSNLNDNGEGSLRQAIANSNTQAGADEIVFADSLSGRQITLTSGELQISDDLNITGLGAENLTISGNDSSRVFVVNDGDASQQINVSIDNLTVANGVATSEIFGDLAGGGIFNGDESGSQGENLKVTNSKVINNQGGGIFNGGDIFGSQESGKLELINSTVSGNTKRGVSNFSGAETTIRDSEISNNLDSGIFNGSAANTTIINSRITGNSTDSSGGGITSANFGSRVEAIDSEISNNYARAYGGGISNGYDSSLILTNTTVSDNRSVDGGGGIDSSGFNATATIENSSINNNLAFNGGGINIDRLGNVKVTNSFLSGNTAEGSGGAINVSSVGSAELVNTSLFFNRANRGGAISRTFRSNLKIINGTIALNGATDTGGIIDDSPYQSDPSEIGNTVITQNIGGDFTGGVNSLGNNFIGNKDNSNGFGDTDIAGTNEDPLNPLFAFFDNPGVQPDRSILIDAGNNDLVPEGIETDILGSPRIIDGNGDGIPIVDIGAFEAESDGNLAVLSDIDLIA